jgi:hypothetical protein
MPVVPVPYPCVVYIRRSSGAGYTFSHFAESMCVLKSFPASLRTSDLRVHDTRPNRDALGRACFLVLVAGDVAQCVSVDTAECGKRTRFLYLGSSYARRPGPAQAMLANSDLSEDYIPLHFHATMAVFDRVARFHSAVPLESGIALFPRQIQERDIPLLAHWVQACMTRSCRTSVWVSGAGDSYNEHTLECRTQRGNRLGL